MDLSALLNEEPPPARCDHRMFLANILNEEPVEQPRRANILNEEPVEQHSNILNEEPVKQWRNILNEEPVEQHRNPLNEEPVQQRRTPPNKEPVEQSRNILDEKPVKQRRTPLKEPVEQRRNILDEQPVKQRRTPLKEPVERRGNILNEEPVEQPRRANILNEEPVEQPGRANILNEGPVERRRKANTLNEEPVKRQRRSLPSQAPQPPRPSRPPRPSQTASDPLRPAIHSRSYRIEPRRARNWATPETDRIPAQQVPAPRSAQLVKHLEFWEGMVTEPPPVRRRGAFCEEDRRETENTRRNKACFRCRNQQIRCVADSEDPRDWCRPCKIVFFGTNKKTIHKLPCLRVKITASVIYRGGLRGGTNPRPPPKNGGNQMVRITFGLCEEPIVFKMPQPRPYDSGYAERNPEENASPNMRYFPPAYRTADSDWLTSYIGRHACEEETLELGMRDSHPFIQETYRQALSHYRRLTSSDGTNETKHQILMRDLFRLWFAMRHLTGPSWICGEGESGIETDETASERTLTPPHVIAQFEVNMIHALGPLRAEVLTELEAMLVRNNSEDWYTIYLAVFVLLHEVSVATKDQNSGGAADSSQSPDFVQNLHEGANTLILHWHYWVRNADPLKIKDHRDSSLSGLTDAEFKFVKSSYETMLGIPDEMDKLPAEDAWEHQLFWVSQIFGPWKKFVGLAAPLMERRNSDGSLPGRTKAAASSPSSSSSSSSSSSVSASSSSSSWTPINIR